jgi:hypothetical protein
VRAPAAFRPATLDGTEPFEMAMTFQARAGSYRRITVKMCPYSVPARFLDRKVTVHLAGDVLVIFDDPREMGRHFKLAEKRSPGAWFWITTWVLPRNGGALPRRSAAAGASSPAWPLFRPTTGLSGALPTWPTAPAGCLYQQHPPARETTPRPPPCTRTREYAGYAPSPGERFLSRGETDLRQALSSQAGGALCPAGHPSDSAMVGFARKPRRRTAAPTHAYTVRRRRRGGLGSRACGVRVAPSE